MLYGIVMTHRYYKFLMTHRYYKFYVNGSQQEFILSFCDFELKLQLWSCRCNQSKGMFIYYRRGGGWVENGGSTKNWWGPRGGLWKLFDSNRGVYEKNVTTSKVLDHFHVKTSIICGVYENFWITWGGLCKFRTREGGSRKKFWIYRNFDPSPSRQY